jgi:hypothetical protein
MGMAATDQVVYNHDVVAIYNRLNRFIEELTKSVSSGLSLMNAFDIARLEKYLAAIDSIHAWVIAQPQLDLPETAPRAYTLEPAPIVPDLENEDVADILRLFGLSRDELTNSQSARQGSGLVGFDSTRLTAITSKTKKFIEDYVKKIQPLDLPESSPQNPLSGSGKTGT